MTTSPVRVGLIGAGTFARKAHIPSLLALPTQFEIVAVCSRTRESAETVAALLPQPITQYTEMAALLADDRVEAVDITLPIPLLPAAVEMALAAGKHVISEKPIAPTLAAAQPLLDLHARHADQVWMVGENWRYEESFQVAAAQIGAGRLGQPLLCQWSLQLPIMPGSPGHKTTWRRTGDFPGGFLLDGGVHHVAGLRLVLGEIRAVTAMVAGHRADLPPADTLSATLEFANGALGSYSVTYAARSGLADGSLHVVGTEGSLRVSADSLTIWRDDAKHTESFSPLRSVERELAAFAHAIRNGTPHLNSPQAALYDLAVVEAMLAAAASGARQSISTHS